MTMHELAALAGVSVATVSKALSNASDLSPETKERIRTLAKEHDVRRPLRKQNASRKKNCGPRVGLIYNEVISPCYSEIVQRYSQLVEEQGGVLLACDAHFSQKRALELVKYLDDECHVDGIVSICASFTPPNPRDLHAPLVLSYGSFDTVDNQQFPFDHICIDSRNGFEQAVGQLLRLGHERFAFIGEMLTLGTQEKFENAANAAGFSVSPEYLRCSNLRYEDAGYYEMKKLLELPQRPTAVLCAYDNIALGASQAAAEAGLRIPEDLSLVGVGNSRLRTIERKVIASIDTFVNEQARIVMKLLASRMEGTAGQAVQSVHLQSVFIPLDTVGPAPDRI